MGQTASVSRLMAEDIAGVSQVAVEIRAGAASRSRRAPPAFPKWLRNSAHLRASSRYEISDRAPCRAWSRL